MLWSKQKKLKTRGKYKTCHSFNKNMLVIEEISWKSGLCLIVAPRLLLPAKSIQQTWCQGFVLKCAAWWLGCFVFPNGCCMLYQTRICCNICPRLPGGAFSQVPLFNIDIGVNIITVCHFLVMGWLIKLILALYMKTFCTTQSFPTTRPVKGFGFIKVQLVMWVILWISLSFWRLLMLSCCLGLLSGCSILGKLSVNFFCLECPLCSCVGHRSYDTMDQ